MQWDRPWWIGAQEDPGKGKSSTRYLAAEITEHGQHAANRRLILENNPPPSILSLSSPPSILFLSSLEKYIQRAITGQGYPSSHSPIISSHILASFFLVKQHLLVWAISVTQISLIYIHPECCWETVSSPEYYHVTPDRTWTPGKCRLFIIPLTSFPSSNIL